MINSYNEMYLDDAMQNLGEAVDYAVCSGGTEIDVFLDMFVASGISDSFESGVPKYVSGMSGTELAAEVFTASGIEKDLPAPARGTSLSPEYWCGWTLALYQWHSGCSFRRILRYIRGLDLLRMYPALHESPEEKSIEAINRIIEQRSSGSRLQTIRESRGLSQRQLAERSGINLRTIQQYEIRAKNINRAAAETLFALSRTLGCRMDDLFEIKEKAAG